MGDIQNLIDKLNFTEESSQTLNDIDETVESELNQIDNLINNDQIDEAFASLLQLTSVINMAMSKMPTLVRKLEKWIKKIKNVVEKLAKKVGANQYSISTGVPWGVSVSVSFPVVPRI